MSDNHEEYFKYAAAEAQKSMCSRARCGSVIVQDAKVLGKGFNSPPLDEVKNSMCDAVYYDSKKKPKSDRTCCIHAEWRAIIQALRTGKNLKGSSLYFTRVGTDDAIQFSGNPYCTVCSRLALDVGISYFVLWHESGIKVYPTYQYNKLSYSFHTKTLP